MDLRKIIINIRRCVKRRDSRKEIEESLCSLRERVNTLERKYVIQEKLKDNQNVLIEEGVHRICNSIEAINGGNKKNTTIDKVIKILEIALTVISVIISAWAVNTTRTIADDQIQVAKLAEKGVVSCQYFQEKTELFICKENGIFEYVNVEYIPFFATSFAVETEENCFIIPKEPILININADWESENVNQSSQTILKRDITSWNDEYYPILRNITEYFDGKMASSIQLGYIIKIEYFDTINEEQCSKYYKLLTNVHSGSNAQVSIGMPSRYDTYEIKEIEEAEAQNVFDNMCILSMINKSTWPMDFYEKYESY